MKLSAVLSVAALFSGSASAAPVEETALETRATRVPIQGIICNPQNFPGAQTVEYHGILSNLKQLGLENWEYVQPGKCPRRTSWGYAAVHLCNDNPYQQPIGNGDAREMVVEIIKKCAATGQYYSGQAFTTHGWNVVIRGI